MAQLTTFGIYRYTVPLILVITTGKHLILNFIIVLEYKQTVINYYNMENMYIYTHYCEDMLNRVPTDSRIYYNFIFRFRDSNTLEND